MHFLRHLQLRMEINVEQQFQLQQQLHQPQETARQYSDGIPLLLVALHFNQQQQIIIIPRFQIQQHSMFQNSMVHVKVFVQRLQLHLSHLQH